MKEIVIQAKEERNNKEKLNKKTEIITVSWGHGIINAQI